MRLGSLAQLPFLSLIFLCAVVAQPSPSANAPDFSKAVAILNQDNNFTGYSFIVGDVSGTLFNYDRGPILLPSSFDPAGYKIIFIAYYFGVCDYKNKLLIACFTFLTSPSGCSHPNSSPLRGYHILDSHAHGICKQMAFDYRLLSPRASRMKLWFTLIL